MAGKKGQSSTFGNHLQSRCNVAKWILERIT
jgi:hypothetical protein